MAKLRLPRSFILVPLLVAATSGQARQEEAKRKDELLAELQERFRVLEIYHAEFDLEGVETQEKGPLLSRLSVDMDLKTERTLCRVWEKGHEDGDPHLTFFIHRWSIVAWASAVEATKIDLTELMETLEAKLTEVSRDLGKLIGTETPASESTGRMLIIDLQRKKAKDGEGLFRIATGRATGLASWFSELAREEAPRVRATDREVLFELDSGRKRIALDRATGFLRWMEAVDFDENVRRIRLRRFACPSPFPDVLLPPKIKLLSVPQAQLRFQSWTLCAALCKASARAFRHWDTLVREGKAEHAVKLFTRWAAALSDVWYGYALRGGVASHVRRKLDQGIPLSSVRKDFENELAEFRSRLQEGRAEIDDFLRDRTGELRVWLQDELIATTESERGKSFEKALREALDFDAVEKERRKSSTQSIDKIFREELERAAQL